MNKNRPLIGVGIIVIKEDKVLLGKRKGAHGSGYWAPPGGHLEFRESVEDCARRELKEETNLVALSLKSGPWTEDVMESNKHYVTLFVLVDDFEGELKLLEPDKCEGWQWFEWENLPLELFLPVHSLIRKTGIADLKSIQTNWESR